MGFSWFVRDRIFFKKKTIDFLSSKDQPRSRLMKYPILFKRIHKRVRDTRQVFARTHDVFVSMKLIESVHSSFDFEKYMRIEEIICT